MLNYFLYSSFGKSELSSHFSGFAYNSRSLILDKEGAEGFVEKYGFEELAKLQGQFCSLVKEKDSFYLITDILGSEPVFYYSSSQGWAFSNSLYHLAQHLIDNKVSLSINDSVAEYFGLKYSLCEQLIGPQTFVREIFLMMQGEMLQIDTDSSLNAVAVSLIKTPNKKSYKKKSYSGCVVDGVREVGNVLHTLEKLYPGSISIDLTGGVDSRVVFGIASRALESIDKIHVTSSVNQKRDYEVAKKITKYFDIKLDNRKPSVIKNDELSYKTWKAFNLGVYAPISKPVLSPNRHEWFHVHGGAGEVLRSFYPNSPSKTVDVLEKKFGCDLQGLRMIMKEFCELRGLDFNCKSSMSSIYLESRSRIHFGRPSFCHSLHRVFMPLANVNFMEAAQKLSHEELSRSKVLFDILSATAPELLGFDYDDDRKTLKGRVDRGLSALVSLINFKPLKIYGSGKKDHCSFVSKHDKSFSSFLVSDLELCERFVDFPDLSVANNLKSDYNRGIMMRKEIHCCLFSKLFYAVD
ncbi:hypothetical protein [Thioalkalivibrio sp. ALJT]|uniref:hypothetical protein n=1 Tax=Thioalkalivibrio sp. ALJT TaxID=1158146 RepID=UPI0003A6AF03|nr:hypothetical protein [Thioalkalivibrio sp. ALJT]